ncbi:MAG: tetratricopeptide repeat protein, partial [Deltaproteobacteria bacterium]|nr:tetratricopeptide repeat protein [Deltaproteobacteria bacterium]
IQDEATRVDLLFRAASIYEEKLDQADRAVRVLERVLIIDEENLKASLRLIPVYEEKRDWKRLHRCHEVRLQFTAERPTRREILTTLAGLCQEKLGEPAAAFRWLLAAARENPEDAGLRADLERLAVQLQTWEEVVSLYRENRAALPERPADLLALELQLGRALAEELGETTEAMEAFLRALELDQSCRTALYALEALFKRTARWDDLLDNLGRSFELAADPAERRRLLVEMALVEEEQLGDPPRAAQSYFRVLAELPEDLEALQNLHRLLRGQEEYAQLAEILRRELSVIASAGGAADAEVVELQLELGRILHHRLGRTVEAIGCFSDLLGLTPDHEETITELEGLLDRVELLPRLFEILDPVYESNSQWAKLAGLLERRLALLEEPAARLDMLLRKAEVQDVRLADGQAAFTTYGRALMVDPEDERARLQLLELAERLDCWGELVALHRAVLGPQLPPELACSFQLIIARVEDEKLGHPQQAEEAYRAVLELDPEAKPALDALEQLYTRAEQWERLLEIYLKKRELACDATQREACSFRIGYLWEEMLGNLAEATEVYRAILDEDNGNRQALEALDRLYSAREMWPDLAENLRRQLVLAEGDDALVLTLRLAALLEGELGEAREAIELYHAVLQRRDGDPLATAALERLMVDREHRLTIALLLEPHYQAAGEWEKLSGTLEIQLAAAEDTYDRLQLLHRIAELKELQLQAPRAAFLTYGRALAEMPTDGTTCEQLHRLAEVLGSWAELIQLYEEEVTKLADPELSARFLATCARIYEERLEKIDGALASWHKVLEIEPENVEVIDALIRLLHATEQWSELVEMLRAKIEVAQDPSARIVLLHQAALLYEEMLEDLPRAVAIYRRILELDDRHEAALSALERLYDEQGAWTELLEILERQAELASATSVKKELLARSGELLEARLDERARAVETYRRLLDLDPLDEKTLLALDRLLGAGQDWVGQMEILERRAELVAVPAQRVEIQFRIARLWDVHLDDPLRAVDGYREIVEETPAHAGARAALTEMVRGGRDEQAAAEVMLPLYRRLGEWPLVVEVIELWLVHLADQAERLRLLEEAALVREEQLQDRAAAFATLSRALQEQPQREETLQLLEALSARAGLWPGYVELVEGEAAGKEDELAADLLLRVARALEEELAA